MKEKPENRSVYLTDTQYRDVKEAAEKEGRSFNNYCVQVLVLAAEKTNKGE